MPWGCGEMRDDTPDVIVILDNARLEEIERLRSDNAKLRAACEALLAIKLFTKYKDDCSCAWCLAARALEETK